MELSSSSINAADFAWMLPPVVLMQRSLVPLILPSLVSLVAAWGRTGTSAVSMRVIVYLSHEISTLIESPTFGLNAVSIFFVKSNVPGTPGP